MPTELTDFPDRLSPMLVKELRQGMRARGFVLLFLALQGVLAFVILTASLSTSGGESGSFISGLIFTLFSVAALIVQPMRGMTALSSEITGNTLEMMALTRLSASRIVFGKWIAIVSQTLLILITIFPYLILRYFLGGMVLVGELVFVSLIFLTSVALTAVMVGFSATTAKLVRVLPIIVVVFLLQALPAMMFGGGSSSFVDMLTLATTESRLSILSYVCFTAYLGWCALSHGISAIAPISENHATLRRVVSLVLILIAVALGFHPGVHPYALTMIFWIIVAPALIAALTEPAILLPPICEPFEKRGVIGRLAGFFLLPGWPAGTMFTALIVALAIGGIVNSTLRQPVPGYQVQGIIVSLAALGGLLFPALLSAAFTRQESKRFTNFLLFGLGSAILAIATATVLHANDQKDLLWLFLWNPITALAMVDRGFDYHQVVTVMSEVDAVAMALLAILAFVGMARARAVMNGTNPAAPPPVKP